MVSLDRALNARKDCEWSRSLEQRDNGFLITSLSGTVSDRSSITSVPPQLNSSPFHSPPVHSPFFLPFFLFEPQSTKLGSESVSLASANSWVS